MGRNMSGSGGATGGMPTAVCTGCHAAIDAGAAVKRIAIDAVDFQHLSGVYHEACAQPVVMLLSVMGFLNLQSRPDGCGTGLSAASDGGSRH